MRDPKLPMFAQSRKVTENPHFFDKHDGTIYDLILGMYFQKIIGRDILNFALAFSCHKVKVHMVDMGYCNGTMVYYY